VLASNGIGYASFEMIFEDNHAQRSHGSVSGSHLLEYGKAILVLFHHSFETPNLPFDPVDSVKNLSMIFAAKRHVVLLIYIYYL